MELAKELICNVISDRSGYGSPKTAQFDGEDVKECLEAATKEAHTFLSNGLSIAVHIFLGHEHCKAKQPANCKGCCEIEVWSIQLSSGLGEDMAGKSQMIPMFLKQAIRSQLHFSPTKSWFSGVNSNENLARNYHCVYKVSTSSYFQNEKEDGSNHAKKVEEHQFPTCKLDNKVLNIHVKWLKRENFPIRAPKCPSKRIDGEMWVCPDIERPKFDDGDCPPLITRSIDENGKRLLSRRESKEMQSENAPLMQPTPMPTVLNAIVNGANKPSAAEKFPIIISEIAEIQAPGSDSYNKEIVNNGATFNNEISRKMDSCTQIEKELSGNTESITPRTALAMNISQLIANYQKERKLKEKIAIDSNPRRGSSPAKDIAHNQIMKEKIQFSGPNTVAVPKLSDECKKNREFVRLNSPKRLPRARQTYSPTPFARDRKKPRVPACLLCNFEESALKGRLRPLCTVDGFKLQLAVTVDSFSTQHITAPMTTSFFNESSLYMGNCNVSSVIGDSKMGIQVPKRCILQTVLFNPQGSVVKIFLVHIDVADMPPLSQTFIRQRTFSTTSSSAMPLKQPPVDVNGGELLSTTSTNFNSTGNGINTNEQLLQPSTTGINSTLSATSGSALIKKSAALKFLIHVRLVSDHRGRTFLHGDIKMLLSNKGNDLEGLVSTQTQSTTQMPQFPKYSPIK